MCITEARTIPKCKLCDIFKYSFSEKVRSMCENIQFNPSDEYVKPNQPQHSNSELASTPSQLLMTYTQQKTSQKGPSPLSWGYSRMTDRLSSVSDITEKNVTAFLLLFKGMSSLWKTKAQALCYWQPKFNKDYIKNIDSGFSSLGGLYDETAPYVLVACATPLKTAWGQLRAQSPWLQVKT